jgi:two-component system sensor histidine kinase TctE
MRVRAPLWVSGPSIRRSLAVWLVFPLAFLVPLTAGVFYSLALRPALDSLDHSLDATALALEGLTRLQDGRPSLPLTSEMDHALRADRFDQVFWVVTGPAGEALAGDADLAPVVAGGDPQAWRFGDAEHHGEPVRLAMHAWPCTRPPGDETPAPVDAGTPPPLCEVRVAETLNKRHGVERAVLAAATGAMVLEALVLSLMGWVGIARSLRPVERLSAEIERRSPDHLGAVVQPDIPREVAPLIAALNGLFGRVSAASAAEKAFLADAAHQLRTPLTVLRTETELALMEPHPPQIDGLLRRLHQGATRAARLAHQLLTQARAEHEAKNAPAERFDLKSIASEAVEEWVARSLEAGVDLGFELDSAPVVGRGYLLRELVANLLDNALNYAGPGARVTVRTRLQDGLAGAAAVLEVEDNGPGIAPAERERALERFQRGAGAGGSGSGLGLSIVRDIALHHAARIELRDGPGGVGLCVRVTFPPVAERRLRNPERPRSAG